VTPSKRVIALLLILAVPLPAPAIFAAAPSIRIISPRPGEIVSGRGVLEAEVQDFTPVTVEFFVDGKSAGAARGSPYRVEFDFGGSLASRRIRAVATDASGASVSAETMTRHFDANRIDEVSRVDLVNLYVTVRDRSGKLVQGLEKSDFSVLENGKPQQITHFSSERRRLIVALVLDASLSMKGERIESAREAAARFLEKLAPEDRAMAFSFNNDVRLVHEETSDFAALASSLSSCEAVGGTALYDALYRVADRLAPLEGRKVVVLLSDGRDEAESGLEPGSLHTLEEALDRTLRSEVILYAVGIGKGLDKEMDFYGRRSLSSILDQISSGTGGRAIFLKHPGQLREAFEDIGEELRRQYSLAYTSSAPRHDGSWRELKVSVARPGLKAITRTGYYVPRDVRG